MPYDLAGLCRWLYVAIKGIDRGWKILDRIPSRYFD
jgi:hypothetical protein